MISQNTKKFLRKILSLVIGGYFLWPYSLQRDPKYLFLDSTEIRLAKRSTKYSCNSLRWINRTLSSISESFFPDFIWGYFFFSPKPSMGFQISLFQFHKNCLSERLLEGKAVTLWDDFTEPNEVSQKASFSLLSEDISLGPIVFKGIWNICSLIPQK